MRWSLLLCVALAPMAAPFAPPGRVPAALPCRVPMALPGPAALPHRRIARACPAARRVAAQPTMFGPGSSGGFLNLGGPEVLVIGAVAWAILGPKELYKLARQAGEFFADWQALGRQAQSTFKDAIESELGEDASSITDGIQGARQSVMDAFASGMAASTSAAGTVAEAAKSTASTVAAGVESAEAELREEREAARKAEAEAAGISGDMFDEMRRTLGDPESNRAAFTEQITGERNRQVLDEYPQELSPPEGADAETRLTYAEEALVSTKIAEAENELATLRAEAQVLQLRRQQQVENAMRAREEAEAEAIARREAEAAGGQPEQPTE